MKKRYMRMISFVLAVMLMLSNVPTVFAEAWSADTLNLHAETVYNPLYRGRVQQQVTAYAKRYNSASESNEQIEAKCAEGYDAQVVAMRSGMEDRNAAIALYVAVDEPLTDDTLGQLVAEVFEAALQETDVPTQGDYLRWAWNSRNSSADGFYSTTLGQYCYKVTVNMSYYTTAQQEAELTEELNGVIGAFPFTEATPDAAKIRTIYDYITKNISYDYENLEDESYTLKFTAYAALINKTAVCEGYAVLFYRMAEMCGLDARVIVGIGNGGDHAWNICQLGGSYYYLDSTWDAGIQNYNYFLRGKTDFGDHADDDDYRTAEFVARYPIAETRYVQNPYATEDDVNFTYVVTDGYATVTGYKGSAENVIVPAYLGDYPVRYINDTAISGKSFVKTITLSEGIVGILPTDNYMTARTFFGCENLKTLYLPTTFYFTYDKYAVGTYIGYTDIPNNCESLEKIIVAEGSPYLKSIDGIVYSQDGKYLVACPQNYQGQTLTIPEGVQELSPTAFAYNNNLETLIFGDDVKTVGFEALMYTKQLTQLQLNDSLQTILGLAFMESSLKSLHLPASVNYLEDSALDFMFHLTELTVDPANTTFRTEGSAILSETQLVKYFGKESGSYRVPAGILYISDGAFTDSKLTSVILPEGLYSVGAYAFRDCKNLQHMEIPAGTQMISLGAFDGCDMLATLIVPAGVTMNQSSYDGSTVNGLYLQKNCTIYGEASQGTAPEGWVFIEQFCAANGYTMQPISAFLCHDGHNMQKVILQDNAYEESRDIIYVYRCTVCSCEGLPVTERYRELSEGKLEFYEATYTGSAITPAVSGVVYDPDSNTIGDEIPLTENVDYTVTYTDNTAVGTGFVRLDGLGAYKGSSLLLHFNICRIDLNDLEITLQYTSTIFDGTAKFPAVTVEGARENVDYTVAYHNTEIPGTATVAIRAEDGGNYTGYVERQFEILPATETAVQNLTANFHDYNQIELTWAFDGFIHYNATETGYKVYYKKATDSHYTLAGSVVNQEYYMLPLLEANTKYDFKVVKYVRYNDTEYADNDASTICATTCAPLTKPANLSAVLKGTNTVFICWDAVNSADGYRLYVSFDGGTSWLQQWEGTQTSVTLQWLSWETEHTFKVVPYQLFNEEKAFEDVDSVSVTTLREFDFVFEDGKYYYYAYGEKSAETGPVWILDGIYYLENGAWVQKNMLIGSGDFYEYYENGIRKFDKNGVALIDGEYCLITEGMLDFNPQFAPIDGQRYYFTEGKLCYTTAMIYLDGAYHYVQNGRWIHTFSPLQAPESITAKLTSYNAIYVGWSAVDNATHYKVYFRDIDSADYTLLTTTAELHCQVADLAPTTTYVFKIVPCTKAEGVLYEDENFTVIQINTERKLSAPKTVTAKLTAYNAATVSWSKVSGASCYAVYYRNVKKADYKLLTTTTSLSYKKTGLSSDATYEFKIVPCLEQDSILEADAYKTVKIATTGNLSAPKTVTAKLYGYDDVKVTWSKVSGAKAYRVYYKKSTVKSYTLKTTTSKTSYSFPNLSDGAKYDFKIVPCTYVNGGYFADDSYRTASATTLKKVATPTVSRSTSKKVTVKWSNIAGESGYQISKSTSKSKTSIVATYSTTTGKSKTVSATKGKTYYYKVRAFKTVDGKKIYGPWSSVRAYKLK